MHDFGPSVRWPRETLDNVFDELRSLYESKTGKVVSHSRWIFCLDDKQRI